MKYEELLEARADIKGKFYKEIVTGAEKISKILKIKLTQTTAVGNYMGKGVHVFEIDQKDLQTLSKIGQGGVIGDDVILNAFVEYPEGTFLIEVQEGNNEYLTLVATRSVINDLINKVSWNDTDIRVMLDDFVKTLGTRLGKDDVIWADPHKGSKIQLNRWAIIQLAKAHPGKYGETEILKIEVDPFFHKAMLTVLFDGFETTVEIETKYRPNVTASKAKPYVDEIIKTVGGAVLSDPKSQRGNVNVRVDKETLKRLKKVEIYDYLTRDMFIVWNDKDPAIGFKYNAQLTFICKGGEGTVTFIWRPEEINESSQALNESFNYGHKFVTVPAHML